MINQLLQPIAFWRLLLPVLFLSTNAAIAQSIAINFTGPTQICAGTNMEVPFIVTGSYNPGNTFTLELSDSAGNFAFLSTLGTLNETGSALFGVTIPTTTFAGSTYYIRISGSSPANLSPAFGPFSIKNPFTNLISVDNGLVAYYPMDGNGDDRSGFNNHAYISGSVSPTPNRFGTPGRALEFNGSDGFLIAANSPSLESPQQEISIAAWLYVRGYQGNWCGIMAKTSSSNVGQYNIELNQNSEYRLSFRGTRSTANHLWELNRWTFITITATQDSMFYFIDGQKISSRSYSQGNSIDTMRLEIGRHRPGGTEYFNGFMDEFRIYNRRITDQEVFSLYNENPITVSSPVCVGGEARLTFPPIAGATYQWTGPNNYTSASNPAIVPNLSATNSGSYAVVVTADGCLSEPQEVSLNVNEVAPLPSFERNLNSCAGDSATVSLPFVNATGYAWENPSNFSFPNRSTTSVSIAATSGTVVLPFILTNLQTGCQRRDSVLVSIRPSPDAGFSGVDTLICNNSGPYTLLPNVVGGIFAGQGVSGNIFTPTIIGSFSVTYTLVADGCSSTETINLTVADRPDPAFTAGSSSEVCLNSGNINLVPSSPGGVFSGQGVTGNQFSPSTVGISIITHRIALAGCADSAQITIEVKPIPDARFSGIGPLTCFGTPNSLTPNTAGGLFSGIGVSGNIFSPSDTGTFTIQYRVEANGCSDSARITTEVIFTPNAAFTFSGSDSVCQGSDAIILVPAQTGGVFSGQQVLDGQFTPTTTGIFLIKYVLNLGSCADSSSRTIVVKARPDAAFSGLSDSVCANSLPVSLIPVTAGGTFTGALVNDLLFEPTIVGTTTVRYSVSAAGCEASEEKTVEVIALPNATFAGLPEVICANNGPVNLNPVLAGGTFSGNGVTGNIFNPAAAELLTNVGYTVSQYGCSNTTTQQIRTNQAPSILVQNRLLTIDPGQISAPFNLTVNPTEGVEYLWSPTAGLNNPAIPNPTAKPVQTTKFILTASVDGCSDTASVLVVVSDGLVIPKAFTPNNDGENDAWVIKGLGAFANNKVMVFNRWGGIVFETSNYNNNWNANDVPTGTYYYVVELNGDKKSGTLMVIR